MPLAVVVPLLVYQPGILLTPRLSVSLDVASATGLSTGHLADPVPADVAHSRGLVAVGATGLLAGHGPLHAARGRGPTAVGAAGLSTGHEPLRAARDRGRVAAAGLHGHVVQIVPLAISGKKRL